MAIPRSDVKNTIKSAMDTAYNEQDPANREQAIEAWASEMAGAISQAIDGSDVQFTLTDSNGGAVTGTISLNAPE